MLMCGTRNCGHPVGMRRVLVPLVLSLCACLFAGPAAASPSIRFGIQDDAWLVHGGGTLESRLDQVDRLGVELVRFNLHWDQIEAKQGSPDWAAIDAVLEGLKTRKIDVVVGLVGSPRWANGGKPPNYVPGASAFAAFASQAAKRYPWVRKWLVWNEPNQARWLKPTSPEVYVRSLLNPAYKAIHRANPRAKVAGGVTAPRAGSNGVSPLRWIAGMRAAHAQLDAYAHHPYPGRPSDTPYAGGCRHSECETITMATLERLLSTVQRSFGAKRIWLTEYGYQTGPGGVSKQRQADLIGQAARRTYQAPRVDMLIHYLVVDEPLTFRFQSGLFTVAGRVKPSYAAFRFPLTRAGGSGRTSVLWGQVRPGTGRQAYRIQVRRGSGWRFLTPARRTSARGYLSVAVTLPRGTKVRIWHSTGVGASLTL